jgi:hypothetical protein
LVALNQIEIAGRNAQGLGHGGLCQTLFAAQPAHTRSGKELALDQFSLFCHAVLLFESGL